MNVTILPVDEDTSFRSSVCALVDFVREHPRSGATEIIKPVLASLAFGMSVEINFQTWSWALDETRMGQLLTAVQLRRSKTWPSDYVADVEIREWMGIEG